MDFFPLLSLPDERNYYLVSNLQLTLKHTHKKHLTRTLVLGKKPAIRQEITIHLLYF